MSEPARGLTYLAMLAAMFLNCMSVSMARPDAPSTLSSVVVLSFDGFRHDYPERRSTPGFDRLAREGGRVKRLMPCFPSQTFPAHACLATGVRTDRHGIINNAFRDRVRGVYRYGDQVTWYDAPPLWIHAERRGLSSHVYHWVSSRGGFEGVEPTFGQAFDPDTSDDAKLARLVAWLEGPTPPRLAMVYLGGCDRAGHEHGPDSAEVDACIGRVDRQIATLLERLAPQRERVTILIVSDHGMTETLGRVDVWQPIEARGLEAEVVAAGPVAHVYLPAGAAPESVEAAIATLPHTTSHRGSALPPSLRYARPGRTGEIVVFAAPGYVFARSKGTEPLVEPIEPAGHHGHAPRHRDMGAILFAWGAGVRPGARLATAESVDLVPTVCQLLGIAPPDGAEGRALDALLRDRR